MLFQAEVYYLWDVGLNCEIMKLSLPIVPRTGLPSVHSPSLLVFVVRTNNLKKQLVLGLIRDGCVQVIRAHFSLSNSLHLE